MSEVFVLQLPTTEYGDLPIPYPSRSDKKMKMANFYVRAEDLPPELENWMEVNPRIPKVNKKSSLTGTVARAMKTTLKEEPEKFVLKNQGIYILAEKVEFEKMNDGRSAAKIHLRDSSIHGLVNGGHTFLSIREVAESEDCPDPWHSYVRVHVIEIDAAYAEDIPEIAEGLNRSMQVDDPSLENLKGTFDSIRKHLHGKLGADQIAYRQGDRGEVDIQQVLTYLSMFNLEWFPDRKTHPNILFGHQKTVLKKFKEDWESGEGDGAFNRIIPRVHEILVLTDCIQQLAAPYFGRYKVKQTGKNNRGRSKTNKSKPAYFAGGSIDGEMALGWLYPMLAALRANISHEAWLQGKFEWSMDPKKLLEATIEEMVRLVQQEHKDNNSKPAEVGRKEAAYRGCYSVVSLELAQRGLLQQHAVSSSEN